PAQVEAGRKLYSGAKNPRTGQEVFPGFEPGSELAWATLAGPQPFAIPAEFFKPISAYAAARVFSASGSAAPVCRINRSASFTASPPLRMDASGPVASTHAIWFKAGR